MVYTCYFLKGCEAASKILKIEAVDQIPREFRGSKSS